MKDTFILCLVCLILLIRGPLRWEKTTKHEPQEIFQLAHPILVQACERAALHLVFRNGWLSFRFKKCENAGALAKST
jgi:hypothetical protein